jgi:hypothetical protein
MVEPSIYHTLVEHANVVEPSIYHTPVEHANVVEPSIYHTPVEHANEGVLDLEFHYVNVLYSSVVD